MYETFEHTADVGLRIRATDLKTLFADAAKGFYSILVDNPDSIRTDEEVAIDIEGSQLEYLLLDWLNELLYLFETKGLLLAEFFLEITKSGLKARVRGESADSKRHNLAHEIKAITYHRIRVENTTDGWEAEVILDI